MRRRGMFVGVALLTLISGLGCEDDSTSVSDQRYSALSDSSFAVGDSSVLEVENFAGGVVVRAGDPGVVRIMVERLATRSTDLDEIQVEMVELPNGVRVTTSTPPGLVGVSVDLAISVPPDARPTLQNGAGSVTYDGPAEGQCFFSTGAGSIRLELPADVNVEVHLSVAAGSIDVEFPVDGQVGEQVVDGIIGTGADGRIDAQVGAGSIIVVRQ